jgi:hypothetical protein
MEFKNIWSYVKSAFWFYILFSFVYYFSNEYKMLGVNIIDTVLVMISVGLIVCIAFIVIKNKISRR